MPKKSLIKIFFSHSPSRLINVLAVLFVAGLFEGVGIISIFPLLNLIMANDASSSNEFINSLLDNLNFSLDKETIIIFIVVVFILKFLFMYFALIVGGRAAAEFAKDHRDMLLQHLKKANWNFFTKNSIGRISNALVTETNSLGGGFNTVINFLSTLIITFIYLIISLLTSTLVTFTSILFGLIIMFLLKYIVQVTKKYTKLQVDGLNKFMKEIHENFQMFKPMKAMSCEDNFSNLMAGSSKNLKNYQKNIVVSLGLIQAIQEPIFVILVAAVISILSVINPENIVFSEVIFFLVLFYRIFSKVGALQIFYQKMVNVESYYWSFNDLVEKTKKHKETIFFGKKIVELKKTIEFENVSFRYEKNYIFKNLSFSVKSNKIFSIFGPSGLGKTTIIDLIVGLFHPEKGTIRIDKVSLDKLDTLSWRKKVGYVPQDSILFNDTIANNVTLRDRKFSDIDIVNALKLANIFDHINFLPDGIHSNTGEKGMLLSGGQRYRITIARALIRKPTLLILDEPTAALDKKNKINLINTLKRLKKSFTIICVTHDEDLINSSDNYLDLSK